MNRASYSATDNNQAVCQFFSCTFWNGILECVRLFDDIDIVDGMKKIYLLGIVPPAFNVAGALFSRDAEPYILGMPPMLAWVVAGVVVTSVVMQVIYHVDKRSSLQARTEESRRKEAP